MATPVTSSKGATQNQPIEGQQGATQAQTQTVVMSDEEKELTSLGLTLKEARGVIQMRNARSENIGIRVNKEELSAIDDLHDYLVLHGYIKEGRANLLVYLVATAIKPKPTQLEANLK